MSGVKLEKAIGASMAKSGLSLNPQGYVVLGNDLGDINRPGKLLSHRQIFFNGYSIQLFGGYLESNNTTFEAGKITVVGNGGISVVLDEIEVYGCAQVKIVSQSVVARMYSWAGPENTGWFPEGIPVPAGVGFVNCNTGGQWMNFGNINYAGGGGCRYFASYNGTSKHHSFYNAGRLDMRINVETANVEILEGGLMTKEPTAAGAGVLLVGKVGAAAVALDPANYLEIKIDGVVKKLALVN